jgi:hypothetical protein
MAQKDSLISFFWWFEGLGLNTLLQIWPLLDPKAFCTTFSPYHKDDPVLDHALLQFMTRAWAYMIMVMGAIEMLVLGFGSLRAIAGFLVAGAWGDVLHVIVWAQLFIPYGVWDAGAYIGVVFTFTLFSLRLYWLAVNFQALKEKKD